MGRFGILRNPLVPVYNGIGVNMSNILNIRVTERELDLIMDLLNEAGLRTDADGQPAIEL